MVQYIYIYLHVMYDLISLCVMDIELECGFDVLNISIFLYLNYAVEQSYAIYMLIIR